MRLLPLIFLTLAGSLVASEPTAYPLWDGQESVAGFARKINLPATKSLDLGNGVSMELVLIPGGKFIMGTPQPTPVDEAAFQTQMQIGQALLAVSGTALLVMLAAVILLAVRKRQRPKYSLLSLLAMTVAASGTVLSGLHWRQSAHGLEAAKTEYAAARARYIFEGGREFLSHMHAHPVILTRPFYMGKFVVTQEQYRAITGAYPVAFQRGDYLAMSEGTTRAFPEGANEFTVKDYPAESLTWDDAQAFCKRISATTHETVRLPTEAEWECACRAGTRTTYYSGDTEADLGRVAWYIQNSQWITHPVGQKEPNAFGLYDMHGNVWQWCQDFMGESSNSPATDPQGPRESAYDDHYRVMRGGCCVEDARGCRAAHCIGVNPVSRGKSEAFGFRVVSPVSNVP